MNVFSVTDKYKTCIVDKPGFIIPIILIHNAISTFLYTGWLFTSKFVLCVYILLTEVLLLHWITNEKKCVITQYENLVCGFNPETRYDPITRSLPDKETAFVVLNAFIILFSFIALVKIVTI